MPAKRLETGLLIAITALLAVLAIALVVAGVMALRLVPEAMGLLRDMRAELVATRLATQELRVEVDRMQALAASGSVELAQRQAELQQKMQARARQTASRVEAIAGRRERIPERVSANPLAKLDTVIALNQIMADEILVLNRQLYEALADMAGIIGPLEVQERATASGRASAPDSGAR